MPSVVHKAALREAISADLANTCDGNLADLLYDANRAPEGAQNILDVWWIALTNVFGSMELAYRRGYQAGYEDAEAAKEKK